MVCLRGAALLLLGLAFSGPALPVMGADELRTLPSEGPDAAAEPTVVESAPVPDRATRPKLAGLPRVESDVPRFAGPATLKLSGKPGVHRWRDVSFGAQDVVLRMALVPGKGASSCAASVRLGSAKPPLHRQDFTAESAAKAKHKAVVDVDYRTVPLLVASDCATWSLTFIPRDDPTLPLTISQRTYTVQGKTIPALAAELEHIDGEWAALARSRADWTYRWIDRGSYCEVISGAVSVKAWLKLPKWKRPQDADRRVVNEWQRVRESLLLHELGHITITLQAAHAVDERLDAGLRAKTCKRVDRLASEKATRIWDRHQARDVRYDRRTEHGRTQGTWFE